MKRTADTTFNAFAMQKKKRSQRFSSLSQIKMDKGNMYTVTQLHSEGIHCAVLGY